MTEIEWWDYDDAEEMAEAVAGDIGFIIDSAIDARGAAVIALAGGKTPLPIYQKLAETKRDWKRVTIIPTDERIVPLGDPLSNVTMIGKAFIPRGARVVPIVSSATADYKAAGRSADALMQDLHWPLDLCLLGVGADGHTASIFPGDDYGEALNGPPPVLLSVMVTVKLNVPVTVGVPDSPPPAESTTPAGNAPALTAYAYGAMPPLAASACAYAAPAVASARLVVMMATVGADTVMLTVAGALVLYASLAV